VGFDGIDGHEKFVGDLLVGESGGHEFEDLVFAFGDAEFLEARWVEGEVADRDGDGDGLFAGEFDAGPNAEGGEDDCEDAHVEFEGEVAYEEAVFEEFENEDEGSEEEGVEEDGAGHGDCGGENMDVRKT